jgi:hypothetical protein
MLMAYTGMFLYAKVVLENLMLQGTEEELEEELNERNFPDRLDEAYKSLSSG